MSDQSPCPIVSAIPLLVLIALLVFVIAVFGSDSLNGGSQVALLLAMAVCVTISMTVYRMSWKLFERQIMKTIGDVSITLVILLTVGMLSGSWMVSGIVPTLIYYGVQIISPQFFLFTSCIICALVSVLSGSSWTTIATIGVAFIGIGHALDISEAWTAGAIISGAYFGDKMSPLSDTTILASSAAGVDLFRHIRYMVYTTAPSFTIALVIYFIAGLGIASGEALHVGQYTEGLVNTYHISLCFTEFMFMMNSSQVVADKLNSMNVGKIRNVWQGTVMALKHPFAVLRAALIGFVVGVIPGMGMTVATFASYGIAKNTDKHPERFGTGVPEGIIAAEGCNNAVVSGSLVPTFALGIPGSSTTAVMMAALMLHGVVPGPELISKYGFTVYQVFGCLFLAVLVMFLIGLFLAKWLSKVTIIPNNVLIPIICVLITLGAYACRQVFFDIGLMLFFGILGYLMRKQGYPAVPMLLGLIIGPTVESNMMRVLKLCRENYLKIFTSSPICIVLWTAVLLSLSLPFLMKRKKKNS